MYRVLANTPLPDSEEGFLEDTKMYFPVLYDLKFMKEEFDDLKGGLSRMGDVLCVDRFGQQHQAGSDSWLTGLCHFKLMELYLHGINIEDEFNNVLFGLGKSKNEEYYLDQYASKTEQLEREAREYQHMDEHYIHYDQYSHYNPYYMVNHHPMDYQNDNFTNIGKDGYNFYPVSPNHIEYAENEYPMNMPFPMQYQHMQGGRHDINNMNEYQQDNFY
jgi:hypothetical protein